VPDKRHTVMRPFTGPASGKSFDRHVQGPYTHGEEVAVCFVFRRCVSVTHDNLRDSASVRYIFLGGWGDVAIQRR
jgi:hypothetical protein